MTPQTKNKRVLKLLIINAIVIALVVAWNRSQQQGSISLAIAKGKQLIDMPASVARYPASYLLDTASIKQVALANPTFQAALAGKDARFHSAIPLTAGEARYWQDAGCTDMNCALVSFYDFTDEALSRVSSTLTQMRLSANGSTRPRDPADRARCCPRSWRSPRPILRCAPSWARISAQSIR